MGLGFQLGRVGSVRKQERRTREFGSPGGRELGRLSPNFIKPHWKKWTFGKNMKEESKASRIWEQRGQTTPSHACSRVSRTRRLGDCGGIAAVGGFVLDALANGTEGL